MQSFVGHGDSINEIRTQPLKPSLFISASKVGRTWCEDRYLYLLFSDAVSYVIHRTSLLGYGMSTQGSAF
jgi:hypothetical protein